MAVGREEGGRAKLNGSDHILRSDRDARATERDGNSISLPKKKKQKKKKKKWRERGKSERGKEEGIEHKKRERQREFLS